MMHKWSKSYRIEYIDCKRVQTYIINYREILFGKRNAEIAAKELITVWHICSHNTQLSLTFFHSSFIISSLCSVAILLYFSLYNVGLLTWASSCSMFIGKRYITISIITTNCFKVFPDYLKRYLSCHFLLFLSHSSPSLSSYHHPFFFFFSSYCHLNLCFCRLCIFLFHSLYFFLYHM
jgi:hypothetical protein